MPCACCVSRTVSAHNCDIVATMPVGQPVAACAAAILSMVTLGARPSHAPRTPSSALRAGCLHEFRPFFAGEAGLLGACSHFSDTLLARVHKYFSTPSQSPSAKDIINGAHFVRVNRPSSTRES